MTLFAKTIFTFSLLIAAIAALKAPFAAGLNILIAAQHERMLGSLAGFSLCL